MKSMAANRKAITQATFDDAVQENIREFGMCAADAIEDAISQFQAQVGTVFLFNKTK